MPRETKTSTTKITFSLAESLRDKFNRHCAKLNVSAAQRLRDLAQQDIKLTASTRKVDNKTGAMAE